MILVETPVYKIVTEIEHLSDADGEYSQAYCDGAIAALDWIMNGGEGPSKTKLLLFRHECLHYKKTPH
jgi:hypothetical protein